MLTRKRIITLQPRNYCSNTTCVCMYIVDIIKRSCAEHLRAQSRQMRWIAVLVSFRFSCDRPPSCPFPLFPQIKRDGGGREIGLVGTVRTTRRYKGDCVGPSTTFSSTYRSSMYHHRVFSALQTLPFSLCDSTREILSTRTTPHSLSSSDSILFPNSLCLSYSG